MWWLGAATLWLVTAGAVALLLGAVVRRSHACGRDVAPLPAPRVAVPAQRSAPPTTPPYGLRSQGHLSCAASVRPRP